MFSVNCKNVFTKNKWNYLLHRYIASESRRDLTEKISANPNATQKDVEVHRPLTEHEIQKIINLDNIHIVTKFQKKLPQRPPLIKNFFIGKVDNELLTYPQVMEVKDFNEMFEKLQPISNYFIRNACTPTELKFRDVSNEMMADFRSMKLFGSSVHQRYAGSGYFKSEMNWASECEANDIKSFLVLSGHRLAIEAISDHGNISQHNEYLMEMARGEKVGAVCLHDPLNTTESETVTVTRSRDGDFILNGSKSFAICSQFANLLIVVAKKADELKMECDEIDDDEGGEFFDSYITFVVDPNSSGITISDENQTIGCTDVPYATLSFSNVRVDQDQILSETHDDRKISEKLIASSRLQSATLNMVHVKNILTHLINFFINAECNSEKLRDLLYVRENLAKIACQLYGLESMIYLTAGIHDRYDNPKIDLECAITKAYSQDILRNITQFAMNLIDTPSTILAHPFGLDIRDVIQLQFNETSSALKAHVGRIGMQHAKDHFGQHASDYKDSWWLKFGLSNPTIEYIEKKLYLGDYLHPTFMDLAEDLEFSIMRLQYSCEILLNRYGKSAAERQNEIQTLGEAVMWNYAMFASIGRASRSYCIGLRYSAYETLAVESLFEATSQILKIALDIKHNRSGYHGKYKAVAETIFSHRNQLNPITSILQSGLIQKTRK